MQTPVGTDPAVARAAAAALRTVLSREQFDKDKSARLVQAAPTLGSLIDEQAVQANAAKQNASAFVPLAHDGAAYNRTATLQIARFYPRSPSERAPILPTLFMPGFPKAATSWLYGCLLHAFSADSVGCGRRADGWSSAACGRRFAVTALASNSQGRMAQKKELFYYGGKKPDRQFHFSTDQMELHGPDPTAGRLAELPPLWPWEPRPPNKEMRDRLRLMCRASEHSQSCRLPNRSAACASTPRCSNLGTAACEEPAFANFRGVCRGQGGRVAFASSGCHHPACVRSAPDRPAYSGMFRQCLWDPHTASDFATDSGSPHAGVSGTAWRQTPELYCTHSLLPWAREGELNATVVDFTPNYICDADAMRRLYEGAAGQPSRLKFIVVMRDPIMRAFSEWSMFSLGWNWDGVKNFSASMSYKVAALKTCNRTLFMRPQLLRTLPTAELAAYMQKCFDYGGATMYATTSLYGVCMLHARRYFKREQFLVLKYEDLMKMEASDVLKTLSNFTGLHLNDDLLRNPKRTNRCQPTRTARGGKRTKGVGPNSYSTNSVYASEMLAEASPALERFFAPYTELLRDTVQDASLRWEPRDHRRTPLSEAEKKHGLEEAHKYRLFLRQRQVTRIMGEDRQRRAVRASQSALSGRGRGGGGRGGGGRGAALRRGRGRGGRGGPTAHMADA